MNTKTNDDLSLTVSVPRVDNGIHVGTVAKRSDHLKLLTNARIHLLIVSSAKLELKFLGKARKIVQGPTGRAVCLGVIGLNIAQRKQMTERPCDQISVALQIALPFLHLSDAGGDISTKARLFGNDQDQDIPLLPVQKKKIRGMPIQSRHPLCFIV